MKRQYDLMLGLGGACCCSQAMRTAGLQFVSFPFDWVAHSDIRKRADQVRDDFADWLPKDAMEPYQFETTNTGVVMRNVRTGIVFPHDFHRGAPFDEEWAKVAAKYRRRADRMAKLVAASKRVLLVWVDVKLSPPAADEDLGYARDVFAAKWPGVAFDIVAFRHKDGQRFGDYIVTEVPGIRTVSFDYRDRREQYWIADHRLIGGWLKKEYAVPDYRTPEEVRRWAELERTQKYERFKAMNRFDYAVTKIEYKIYSHFRKRLARLGIVQ